MECKSKNIEELLTTYLEGECSEEEKIKALEWINSREENKNCFFALKSARNLSIFQNYPDRDKLWNKIQGDLNKKNRFDYRVFLKIAAVFIIAIGLGITAAIFSGRVINREPGVLNETIVPYGGKAELRLSDGTVVHLNSGSKFSYPSVFSKTERTVYLEGEAFFKVKTNKKKPFVVNTNDATIKAYGTEFNVNAYKDEPVVTATLVEGIITVSLRNKSGQEVVLKPKEHAIIHKKLGNIYVNNDEQQQNSDNKKNQDDIANTHKTEIENPEPLRIKSKIDTDIYTSWKEDSWIIENESLQSLSKKLERRYDIEISFSDETVKNLRFTGRIVNEPLEQVLLYISLTASLNHKIEGRNVELYLDTTKIDYKTLYHN